MDCKAALWTLRYRQELLKDGVAGRAAIDEEEIVMLEPRVREASGVVDLLVQPHYCGDVVFSEVGEVCFGSVVGIT